MTTTAILDSCRRLLRAALGALLLAAAPGAWSSAGAELVEVWKSPTCGCCKDWIAHMEKNGFKVRTHEIGNDEARRRLGMPVRYGSCHTAKVGGYVIEGHVPARDVKRLLKEKPAAVGLSAPGMPVGSPGMDGPEYRGHKDAYDVLLIRQDGSAATYHSYR